MGALCLPRRAMEWGGEGGLRALLRGRRVLVADCDAEGEAGGEGGGSEGAAADLTDHAELEMLLEPERPLALVLSSESRGPSAEARTLLQEWKAGEQREAQGEGEEGGEEGEARSVAIRTVAGFDSLGVASAGAILLERFRPPPTRGQEGGGEGEGASVLSMLRRAS